MSSSNYRSTESLGRTRRWQLRRQRNENLYIDLRERPHSRFNPTLHPDFINDSSSSSDDELLVPIETNHGRDVDINSVEQHENIPDTSYYESPQSGAFHHDSIVISGSDPDFNEESDGTVNSSEEYYVNHDNVRIMSGSDINSDSERSQNSESNREDANTRNNINVDEDEPLYEGASITQKESMLSLLTLLLTQNLSSSSFAVILQIVKKHLPPVNCFNDTLYKFWKYFENDQTSMIKHIYCKQCFKVLRTQTEICECTTNVGRDYFIQMPIISQLQNLYSNSEFVENLNSRAEPREMENEDDITEMYDSKLYKKFTGERGILSNPNNISFTWYTDGAPVFKSKSFSIWPVFLMINELPYKERIKKENLIVAILWFGENKPIPNMYLKPMYEELKTLRNGVNFFINGPNIVRNVKALLLAGTGDMPAKADILNHTHHNGYYSCLKCKSKGYCVSGEGYGNTLIFPFEGEVELRTKVEHERYAIEAYNERQPKFGVKGPSILARLMPDMIVGVGIDIMHCVYLGITKRLTELWLSSTTRDERFSLYNYKDVIESRLLQIKPPYSVKRMPRSILTDSHYWKASEWKSWFFFYSVPILQDIMKPVYLNHYLQLIHGIYLLSQTHITQNSIDIAEQLLTAFLSKFQYLYDCRYMSINFHMLLHLAEEVRNLGPLWTMSCFPFEDSLGKVLKYIHGTTHVGLQMYKKIAHNVIISNMIDRLDENSDIKTLCKEMLVTGKRWKKKQYIGHKTFIVGKIAYLEIIPLYISSTLENNNIRMDNINVWIFNRLKKSVYMIYTKNYSRGVSFISNCVRLSRNNIGFIKTFIKICYCDLPCDDDTCNSSFFGIFQPAIIRRSFKTPHNMVIDDTEFHEDNTRLNANNSIKFPYLFEITANINETTENDSVYELIKIDEIEDVCFVTNISEKTYVGIPANSMDVE